MIQTPRLLYNCMRQQRAVLQRSERVLACEIQQMAIYVCYAFV